MSLKNEVAFNPDDVWKKAIIVPNVDPKVWRKDYAGAWIKYDDYGKTTNYAWEVDHRKPVSKGGTDDLANLNPLHWENNRTKCDDYPKWQTSVSSSGNTNVPKTQNWHV
ncbi:MAG: HNH endonuclease [Alphaproteobacteria bacterium]|nr:HNH endonuclease [Alphaproteobacteria bacterium]